MEIEFLEKSKIFPANFLFLKFISCESKEKKIDKKNSQKFLYIKSRKTFFI